MISFGIWAESEAVFWQSWIDAGIATAPNQLAPEYAELQLSTQTQQGWTPTRQTGVDAEGKPIIEAVPGFHANARCLPGSSLYAQFTYGRPQTDSNGALLDIWARTWADMVFRLEPVPEDAATGFHAGHRSVTFPGVRYSDMSLWASPANVIA